MVLRIYFKRIFYATAYNFTWYVLGCFIISFLQYYNEVSNNSWTDIKTEFGRYRGYLLKNADLYFRKEGLISVFTLTTCVELSRLLFYVILTNYLTQGTETTTSDEEQEADQEPPENRRPHQGRLRFQEEPAPEHPQLRDQLELKQLLKSGTEAYHQNQFHKAADCFKAARELVGINLTHYEIDEQQLQVVRYAYYAALSNSECYDDIVKAIQELHNTEPRHCVPAVHIQIARAYCKLNRFKHALKPIEQIQEDMIDNCRTYSWPGTIDETIKETTPEGIKSAMKDIIQQSRMSRKASAVCRFENCLKISSHILPSVNINVSDPEFTGFVRMSCEGKCRIEYHIACWKTYKKYLTEVDKVSDKSFLGRSCTTSDCLNKVGEPSVVVAVEIIGPDGQTKSVHKLDSKKLSHQLED